MEVLKKNIKKIKKEPHSDLLYKETYLTHACSEILLDFPFVEI